MKKFFLLALLLPALALAIYDVKWFDGNRWEAPFYNDGRWGIDITVGNGAAGGTWPQPMHNCYVFGAGPWLGAVVPSTSPETLCTCMYNQNWGGTEANPTLCRYWHEGDTNTLDRVYKYPGDWPPPVGRFPMAPQVPRSDMEMWSCFCDSNPVSHLTPGRPLGIDVYSTVYGFNDSLAQDIFFLKYEVANCHGDSIRQAYFGLMFDPDIGSATDDMTGLILDRLFHAGQDTIRVRNTGFAYDYDGIENPSSTWDSGAPGTVAVSVLSTPRSLGLTAFKKFLCVYQDTWTDAEQYLSLAGYNYNTGAHEPYDTVDTAPGDKVELLATGPFDLAPDSILTFWYAVIASPFDTSELALRCKRARDVYNQRLAGIAEETPSAEVRTTNAATIVHGVLFLGNCPRTGTVPKSVLLDISGRKVMSLRPGANDVLALAPGVYFVREAQAQAQAQAVRKVVITK